MPAPQTEPAFAGLVVDFLAYLEFERGLSRNTLDAYRNDLAQFGTFLSARDVHATEATHAALATFLSDLATGDEEREPAADHRLIGAQHALRVDHALRLARGARCKQELCDGIGADAAEGAIEEVLQQLALGLFFGGAGGVHVRAVAVVALLYGGCNSAVTADALADLIRDSYDLVAATLPRDQRPR